MSAKEAYIRPQKRLIYRGDADMYHDVVMWMCSSTV